MHCAVKCCLKIHNLAAEHVCCKQGKTLTISVKQIFTDFQTAAEKFQKLNYDAMNVEATQFDTDFANFCAVIRELERRLGAVIAQVKQHHLQQLHSSMQWCHNAVKTLACTLELLKTFVDLLVCCKKNYPQKQQLLMALTHHLLLGAGF